MINIMFRSNYPSYDRGQRSSSCQNFVQPDGESVKQPSSRRAMSGQNSELATSNT